MTISNEKSLQIITYSESKGREQLIIVKSVSNNVPLVKLSYLLITYYCIKKLEHIVHYYLNKCFQRKSRFILENVSYKMA